MNLADYLALFSLVAIWSLMAINVFLSAGGFIYYSQMSKWDGHVKIDEYPMVSVLVPAHNEAIVIARTVEALLAFDYPRDRYEVIVVNDNSTDGTMAVLAGIQRKYPERRLIVVNTDNALGGKGKSNALNIGFRVASGGVIAIYDADNTPEPQALSILVENLVSDDALAAVIGKFRTRNRNSSILTRFINIETLAYQCMHQAGRLFFFKLCTIPGTNFVIRREIIERMGGWDPKALAEDTEISFRIYRMGYQIRMVPHAVTWEQEPYTLPIWFKQRTRWVMGNMYVLAGNLRYIFDRTGGRMRLDVLYYALVYVLLLTSLVCSDALFLMGILGYSNLHLTSLSTLIWGMASLVFTLNVAMTLSVEKEEFTPKNVFLIVLMLFSYCKMWVIVSLWATYMTIKAALTKRETKWYKTERTNS